MPADFLTHSLAEKSESPLRGLMCVFALLLEKTVYQDDSTLADDIMQDLKSAWIEHTPSGVRYLKMELSISDLEPMILTISIYPSDYAELTGEIVGEGKQTAPVRLDINPQNIVKIETFFTRIMQQCDGDMAK